MTTLSDETGINEGIASARRYPLFDAIMQRRSRRFPVGAVLPHGPTAYTSKRPPQALTSDEEALLVAAAVGLSGRNLADMHFSDETGASTTANTMLQFTGRTFASACGSHATELFYTNDDGSYVVSLRDSIGTIAESTQDAVKSALGRTKQIAPERLYVPPIDGVIVPFNRWAVNQPGSTVFIPLTDVTREYINLLMTYLSLGVYLYDDLNGGVAEPLAGFNTNGRLDRNHPLALSEFEAKVSQVTTGAEQAFIAQNLSLAVQAMGLGGWVFSAAPTGVVLGGTPLTPGLGFRFMTPAVSTRPRLDETAPMPPIPIGLDSVMQSAVPPYYSSMAAAVQSVYDEKWGADGIYLNGSAAPGVVFADMADVPRTPDWVVDAAKTLCEHIWSRYGRFPATVDPIQSLVWYQAHHLDTDFYDRYYPEGAYHAAIAEHGRLWHPESS